MGGEGGAGRGALRASCAASERKGWMERSSSPEASLDPAGRPRSTRRSVRPSRRSRGGPWNTEPKAICGRCGGGRQGDAGHRGGRVHGWTEEGAHASKQGEEEGRTERGGGDVGEGWGPRQLRGPPPAEQRRHGAEGAVAVGGAHGGERCGEGRRRLKEGRGMVRRRGGGGSEGGRAQEGDGAGAQEMRGEGRGWGGSARRSACVHVGHPQGCPPARGMRLRCEFRGRAPSNGGERVEVGRCDGKFRAGGEGGGCMDEK